MDTDIFVKNQQNHEPKEIYQIKTGKSKYGINDINNQFCNIELDTKSFSLSMDGFFQSTKETKTNVSNTENNAIRLKNKEPIFSTSAITPSETQLPNLLKENNSKNHLRGNTVSRSTVVETVLTTLGRKKDTFTGGKATTSNQSPSKIATNQNNVNRIPLTQFGRVLFISFHCLTLRQDYLLNDVPLSIEKIKYKLGGIGYKLDVEQKVYSGTERMHQALIKNATSVDQKRMAEIDSKMKECARKVLILQKAECKYKSIIPEGVDIGNDEYFGSNYYTNHTTLSLHRQTEFRDNASDAINGVPKIRQLRQPLSGKFYIKVGKMFGISETKAVRSETSVLIKIDGNEKGTTRVLKSFQKWNEEFIITVEKSSEIEVSILEKGGNILGSVWFKLWELEEALRARRKAFFPIHQTAIENAENKENFKDKVLEGIFDLEPAGTIELCLNFVNQTNIKRKEGVARRKNVQKVFPMDDSEGDSIAQMRHRIPHKFEPTNNLLSSWCCHCGSMLSFSKKQSLRCSECSIMSHKSCAHLVPNFCGLNPMLISQMLKAIETVRSKKSETKKVENFVTKESPKKDSYNKRKSIVEDITTAFSFDSIGQSTKISNHQSINQQLVSNNQSSNKASNLGTKVVAKNVPRNVGLNDFNFLAVLGKGNFGKVMLAEEKWSKKMYAIKVLKKEFIIDNGEVDSTRSEKRVFLAATRERHPFMINLHSCFQTESRIYFVMEYVAGGDLMWHIQRQYFTEQQAKFYACEVLLALTYFHKQNIIYRDLKLDNILLTIDGHIKLTDFGLCKENMKFDSRTSTFCGTPEFMAPEILEEKPYGRAVDWWAFGVLIYEMVLGQSPFKGEDEEDIFEAILHDEILYPVNMTRDTVGLLQQLLMKSPDLRLGSGPGDGEDIKVHPYFRGIVWEDVINLRIPATYLPKVSSPTDVSNFDSEFTKEPPVLTPCRKILSAVDQDEFKGFTHVSEWATMERINLLTQRV
ncbi:Serine/threonine kinase [Clydaea vesicula]|uniref:protein kinase C n=1 Tax=Clydaea vesicula TaxID=447962 RepID=A0AAD5XV65_9FUNG|nr:Serine/threonine kinase [Clydaea vesicula]